MALALSRTDELSETGNWVQGPDTVWLDSIILRGEHVAALMVHLADLHAVMVSGQSGEAS